MLVAACGMLVVRVVNFPPSDDMLPDDAFDSSLDGPLAAAAVGDDAL